MPQHDAAHMRTGDADIRGLERHAEGEGEIEEIPIIRLVRPRHVQPAPVVTLHAQIEKMCIVEREHHVREQPRERQRRDDQDDVAAAKVTGAGDQPADCEQDHQRQQRRNREQPGAIGVVVLRVPAHRVGVRRQQREDRGQKNDRRDVETDQRGATRIETEGARAAGRDHEHRREDQKAHRRNMPTGREGAWARHRRLNPPPPRSAPGSISPPGSR